MADARPQPPPPIPPSVFINGPSSVASGATVTFTSSVTVSPGAEIATYAWTATKGTLGTPTLASTTYRAPVVTATETQNVSLTVTDSVTGLSTTATVAVTVNAPLLPTATISPAGPLSVPTGVAQTLNGVCTFQGVVQLTGCTFTWTQTNIGAPGVPTVLAAPFTGNPLRFTPTLAPANPAATIQLAVVATYNGVAPPAGPSAPQNIFVTVNPVPDQITMTTEYRTGKQRLLITATTTAVGPNVVLRLQPYTSRSPA